MIVTLEHAKTALPGSKPAYCAKGIRLFCKKYGIDYIDFRENGIDSEILLALNDSMANKVVEVARGQIK